MDTDDDDDDDGNGHGDGDADGDGDGDGLTLFGFLPLCRCLTCLAPASPYVLSASIVFPSCYSTMSTVRLLSSPIQYSLHSSVLYPTSHSMLHTHFPPTTCTLAQLSFELTTLILGLALAPDSVPSK